MGKPSRRSRQREHRVSKPDIEILEKAESSAFIWPVLSVNAGVEGASDEEEDRQVHTNNNAACTL